MDMLMFELKRNATEPLYEQLYSAIKQAILEKKIKVGDKLPSKRKLATYLSISNTTVELAYDQLTAEGYIESMPRQGFFVQDVETVGFATGANNSLPAREKPLYSIDFHLNKVDAPSFPFHVWRKLARDVFDESNPALLESAHPQGDMELRLEIAAYLYQSRGVVCSPEQIVIGSGTEQLMPLLIRLVDPASVYAYENPGYPLTHMIFSHHDRQTVPIAVDAEGLIVKELEKTAANVVYVTPSHQFPTGAVMSASRRTQLLKWTLYNSGRYIVEDDYDSEFRYTGRPIPSLQSMDPNGRVIYLSTFSKSLMPSLRIAYMVLPQHLLEDYRKTFLHYSTTVPRAEQQIVARFMKEGHFLRHLNRMRTIYRKKREVLVSALRPYSSSVSISGDQAGMHLVLSIHTETPETQLVELARSAGIRIFGLGTYTTPQNKTATPQLLLGFGGLHEENIASYIDKLMQCLNIKKQPVH